MTTYKNDTDLYLLHKRWKMCLDDRSEFTQSNAQWQSIFSQKQLPYHRVAMSTLRMGATTEISKEEKPKSVECQPQKAFTSGGFSICAVVISIWELAWRMAKGCSACMTTLGIFLLMQTHPKDFGIGGDTKRVELTKQEVSACLVSDQNHKLRCKIGWAWMTWIA